jgi:hypothetical protein
VSGTPLAPNIRHAALLFTGEHPLLALRARPGLGDPQRKQGETSLACAF